MIKKLMLIIAGVIAVLMAAVFLFAKDIEIRLSEAEAQTAINAYLQTEILEGFGIRISPKRAVIDFKADNSAFIDSEFDITGHGYSGAFDGRVSAGIGYRVPRLYLDDPKVIDGGFSADDDVKSELAELKSDAVNALEQYRNSGDGIKAITESPLSSEALIMLGIQKFFESIPIYDISDSGAPGMAASLALKEVSFTEDAAFITLSPKTALLRILTFIGLCLLALVWFAGPGILAGMVLRRES